LGVPIKEGEIITGVIVLQNYASANVFTEDDKNLLIFVSDQIGLSIQNKKIEEDLTLALEKATESDKLKTAFLHNISHEIRTPMNGILGFTSLLKNPQLSDEKQQSFIDIITKSGERMLNTLNDLMDMSKLETGQAKLNLTETNINQELEILFSFFKPEATNKKLLLNLTLPKGENHISINTDREKLYAVLSNLIKNALKFTNIGGIDFGYTLKENCLEFYIMDTGIGIPKNRQTAIFERFIQADISDELVFDGSGLGLSISKSYVEMLGGEIWVESIENQGSQFFFTIPINSNNTVLKEIPHEIETTEAVNANKISVLIVEDEEIASIYLSIIMEDYCSSIYRAVNGEVALKVFNEHPEIDLILLDIKMPKMNGYETVLKIREKNRDVVIIAQTAFTFPGDQEKALRYGCTDYISKPIKATNLIALVKKYFDI
jgi:signal transduction histidine kinase/CheY-like chemotaxis protein